MKLKELDLGSVEANQKQLMTFASEIRAMPVAIETAAANEQHYELPTAFFQQVLGEKLKYSGALWNDGVVDLNAAETAMLDLSCSCAELTDNQDVLELGCGWGSLSLFMAE